MARRKRGGPTMAERARAKVRAQQGEGARFWLLPVSEGYEAERVDTSPFGGVERDAAEVEPGETAIVSRVLLGMVPADLRAWIARARRQFGGNAGIAEQLMAMRPLPAGRDREKYRRAAMRALQRAGPERKAGRKESHTSGKLSAEYAERVGLLRLQRRRVNLWLAGTWYVDDKSHHPSRFRWFATDWSDPDDRQAVREVLAAGGAGYVELLEAVAERIMGGSDSIELTHVAGLRVEVMER